jgi:hypothetical protein
MPVLDHPLRAARAPLFACAAALLGGACVPGEGSLTLSWPNEEARAATKQLAVFAFTADTGAGRQRCRELLLRLPKGEILGRDPVDAPFDYGPGADGDAFERQLASFPIDPSVVMVVGYNESAAELKKPIVQGCTERFGSAGAYDVDLPLDLVLPSGVALYRAAGDRQMGRPGAALAEPLVVKAEAWTTAGMTMPDNYAMPGVPITVKATPPTLSLAGQGSSITVVTDAEGLARIPVTLPPGSDFGAWTVEATSARLNEACKRESGSGATATNCALATQKTFSVAAIADTLTADVRQLGTSPLVDAVRGVAVGDFTGDRGADIAIVGCRGSAEGCAIGAAASGTLGQTRLVVIADVDGASPRVDAEPVTGLGVAPGGLFVGQLVPGGRDEVAVLESRRADCAARRCESSAIHVFGERNAKLERLSWTTLTASNAVGLAPAYAEAEVGRVARLFTAAQGRAITGRACNRNQICLPAVNYVCADRNGPADCVKTCWDDALAGRPVVGCEDTCARDPAGCGCPVGETCVGLDARTGAGVCRPADKFLDQLVSRAAVASGTEGFENELGCHEPRFACRRAGAGTPVSFCECVDQARGGECDGSGDACSCETPKRAFIGAEVSVTVADLATGRLRPTYGPDVVAASNDGIELFRGPDGEGKMPDWQLRRIPAPNVAGVRVATLLERMGTEAPVEDIVWWTREACRVESSDLDPCPIAGALTSGADAAEGGCLGTYLRDASARSVYQMLEDGCRRYRLPWKPDGICVADVNGDLHNDVVASSGDVRELRVFLGDGRGGLLNPPEIVALPGPGGRVACADLDGGELGAAEVVIADAVGRVQVVRFQRGR